MSDFALKILRVTAGVPLDVQENFLDAVSCLNRIMTHANIDESSQDAQHLIAFVKSYSEGLTNV